MGDSEPLGDGAGVVDVAAGAAGLRAADRFAMVVELEGDPDHLGAGAGGERGDDRAVDPARHGDDDPGLGRFSVELEIGVHGGGVHRDSGRQSPALARPSSLLGAKRRSDPGPGVGAAGLVRFARNDGSAGFGKRG
jgi:hypothetical protein